MDLREFWTIIEESDGRAKSIEERLGTLDANAIASFGAWFAAYDDALRREDLWAGCT
jgi:hypothetical protein